MTNQTSTPIDFEADFQRRMAEMDQEIVSDGYTRAELRKWFNLIQNKANWKLPIDAFIPAEQFGICNTAAIFFAGSPLTVTGCKPGNVLHVTGRGYYAEIGA